MFRKSLNRAVLRIRVDTETPLLIRAGDAGLEPAASDLTPVRTEHGRHGRTVYIPGSSLKGVLRAAAEASVRGVALAAPFPPATLQGACEDPLNHRTSCGGQGSQHRREQRQSAEIHAAHCLACRLFGSLAVRGRAAVRDLFPWDPDTAAEDLVPAGGNRQRANQLEQRFGISIDRVTGSVRRGVLFDQEIVPAGVSFWGEIALLNYQVWQLGLLAQAFDAVNVGAAQIGSSKSRGLGSARIEVEALVHEQVATTADRPLGVGALLDGDESRAYGLLTESALPDASAERRGLAVRFTAGGKAAGAWLDAGRAALGGLLP